MAFHEVQFPTGISKGSSGGPRRVTDVVTLRSGFEQRNTIWADSRRMYNAGLGLQDIRNIYDVLEFFEARRGRLHGFRWKDWADYKTTNPIDGVSFNDIQIGVGDGSTSVFQLVKTYSSSNNPWTRIITKPVQGTVKIAIDSVELVENSDFLVDYSTGFIYLGFIPSSGSITAGFEFDVPVRFDQDELSVNVEQFNAGATPDIDIVEIKVSYQKDLAKEAEALFNWLSNVDINEAVNVNWAATWGTI